MSVHNPHQFSPLWLISNSKQGSTPHKSGFSTLNHQPPGLHQGKHIHPTVKSSSYSRPHLPSAAASFQSTTSEFPSLHSSKSTKVAVDNGAWSLPRGKSKLQYSTVKQTNSGKPSTANNTKTAKPIADTPEPPKPASPKVQTPKPLDNTSKFDFFKSLRRDEGLVDYVAEMTTSEKENKVENKVAEIPLSSSVETEHRLLKEMGWSDEPELQPLTDEEVLCARLEIEKSKTRNKSPPVLSPFPWAPKMYLPDDEVETESDDDY